MIGTTNANTLPSHASSHASGGSDPITPASIGAEPAFTKNNAFNKNFGTTSGTVCQGNDSRLTATATTSANGLMSSSDKSKLDGIASGAEVNVQSDWNQTTTTADDYIKNKPTIPSKTSDLTNDSGFITGVSWTQVTDKPTTFTPSAHNHAASEITSGTLSVDRIPSLTKSKISDFPTSMTPTAHASTATTYGVASASNYGHPKATSATPSALGTASVGTDNGLYARGDHVHRNPITISTEDPSGGASGDVWFKYEA